MRPTLRRATTAGSAALLVVLGGAALTGCTTPVAGGCYGGFAAGSASDAVTVTGDVGEVDEIDFPTPLLTTTGTQVTVLEEGEGDPLPMYGVADVEFTILDGRTGQVAQASAYGEGTGTRLTVGDATGDLTLALQCARAGSRIVIVTTGSNTATLAAREDAEPIDPADDLMYVVVFDVEATWLGKANGINQLPLDGMPTVVTAVDGTPGITMNSGDAPTEGRSSAIKAGAGAQLADGDEVLLHYRTWGWPTTSGSKATVQGGTWGAAPLVATLAEDSVVLSDGTDLGAVAAETLIGAKVGSQLLVVTPGADGAATIAVIDVLGVTSAASE